MGGDDTLTGSRHSLQRYLAVTRRRELGWKLGRGRNVPSGFGKWRQPRVARVVVLVLLFLLQHPLRNTHPRSLTEIRISREGVDFAGVMSFSFGDADGGRPAQGGWKYSLGQHCQTAATDQIQPYDLFFMVSP